MEDAFVARPSPFRVLLLLLGALGFVALGLFFIGAFGPVPRPGREWVGWLSILFFGLCFVAGLPRLFDRRDQLVVDSSGLRWRPWSDETIPWSAVRAIERRAVRRQKFLCVYLKDPASYPPTTVFGKLGAAQGSLGYGDIALNLSGTDRRFRDLEAAISRFAPADLAAGLH